jgi:hypothetical protein
MHVESCFGTIASAWLHHRPVQNWSDGDCLLTGWWTNVPRFDTAAKNPLAPMVAFAEL